MKASGTAADRLVTFTERVLTRRRRRRRRIEEKQRKKNVIVDWLEAFLWAAIVVLLINQYLLQAYQIPTGSMIDTLLEQDRVFVNKVIYGPELIPGMLKISSPVQPERNEVIIFENPAYISRGPGFEVLQRLLYMVTLSLVDINRDELGRPRAQFLIKRAVGVAGDRFRNREGVVEILPQGASEWMSEVSFQEKTKISYPVNRMLEPNDYDILRAGARAAGLQDVGVPLSQEQEAALRAASQVRYPDGVYIDSIRSEMRYMARPYDSRLRTRRFFHEQGWYVPEGRILPLGDNRDNSLDGRSFGSVSMERVLGRGMIKYWPPSRIGPIR
ncbi:MAG: signal peptidase I [Spirochaeta sp.]|nr:signal peptidase I [Spirochaeta sp.]